ncbi:MAG TPA: NAD(P)-dependent oxidoreductase [Bauldia sp.]|nr:NAD(P)-dependent oxidoreductase [Bauldia sp.]
MRIFIAGASGAIGRRLVPLLVAEGHHVTGATRSADRVAVIAALGARPAIVDVLDAAALAAAIADARPAVVIHQMTDLPKVFDRDALAAAREANARLRREGTRNLVAAARAAGAERLVAQSVAFLYTTGRLPHEVSDPLDASPAHEVTVSGVKALEEAVTGTAGLTGIVLRYGRLYGPGTWHERPGEPPTVHVDAAADAARLAVTRGAAGIYNIADDDGSVSIERARAELNFNPGFRAG